MALKNEQKAWVGLRLGLGWIFLWGFLDKVFGLGFATKAAGSWLAGGSPTTYYLGNLVKGPFAGIFKMLSGVALVDWLFMLGLLCIGLALLFGVANRIAGYAGALLMMLMWLSVLPPEHNPILDEHIIYAIALLGIAVVNPGQWFGLNKWWTSTKLAKKYKFLR